MTRMYIKIDVFVVLFKNICKVSLFSQLACTINNMDKNKAILLAGSSAKLARLLGVSRQAIHNWTEIPKLRVFQLRVMRPEWFDVIN